MAQKASMAALSSEVITDIRFKDGIEEVEATFASFMEGKDTDFIQFINNTNVEAFYYLFIIKFTSPEICNLDHFGITNC
jgi:hypothetical protein